MDLESKNNSVATPLQLAKDNLHVEIVELIAFHRGIRHRRGTTRRAKKKRLKGHSKLRRQEGGVSQMSMLVNKS